MEETLELLKQYANTSDNWWLERQLEILDIQIQIELNKNK